MEFKARLNEEADGKAVIEVRSFKVCELPVDPPFPSSIDMMVDPPLSTVAIFEYDIPKNEKKDTENEKNEKKVSEKSKKSRKRVRAKREGK